MKVAFVIKKLKKGVWYYFADYEPRPWDEDLYVAAKFATYSEAEMFLNSQTNWGGYFRIEKVFVNK
jgi:hypothetical protein